MRIYDKNGNLIEKDGEKTDNIHRKNIGDKTAEKLRNGEIQEFLARVFDIELENGGSE